MTAISDTTRDDASIEFRHPTVLMPLPHYGTSPALRPAGQQMYAWGELFGLTAEPAVLRHMQERTHPETCIAYYYPTADLAHLALLCQYALWAWVVDDALDDGISARDVASVADAVAGMIRAVEGTSTREDPSCRAASDLFTVLRSRRSAQWQEALCAEVYAWLCTYVTEAAATTQDRVMTLEEYIAHRRYGVDEISFLHLVEFVHEIDLPDAVRNLPSMARARARGSEWIGLYNDIFSAVKENAVGYRHNAVLIVAHQDRCTIQEAVDRVNFTLTDLIHQFESAIAAVPAELTAITSDPRIHRDVAQVIDGYRHVVRGNFDYHINRPRYTDAANYLPAEQNAELRPSFSSQGLFNIEPRRQREAEQ